MRGVDSEPMDPPTCCCCGKDLDDFDRQHGDGLDCGHNVCAECLIAGEALDHERDCPGADSVAP